MAYPKWRKHPDHEPRLIQDEHEESYMAPDDQGWSDSAPVVVIEAEPEVL